MTGQGQQQAVVAMMPQEKRTPLLAAMSPDQREQAMRTMSAEESRAARISVSVYQLLSTPLAEQPQLLSGMSEEEQQLAIAAMPKAFSQCGTDKVAVNEFGIALLSHLMTNAEDTLLDAMSEPERPATKIEVLKHQLASQTLEICANRISLQLTTVM